MIPLLKKLGGKARRAVYSDPLFEFVEMLSYLTYKRRIKLLSEKDELRLHIGCGGRIMPGWINIDMRPGAGILVMRLPKGLRKLKDDSVYRIYASHFLEHLGYREEAMSFVQECYRILVPGGVLRIVVPEIELIIRAYVTSDPGFFEIQRSMHPEWCTTKLEHLMYALQQNGEHRYGYDFETIKKLLSQGGFLQVERSDYNKSSFFGPGIDYRAETDNTGRNLSLFIDAVK
jgi:predicted SAM-dependent methyltransferase